MSDDRPTRRLTSLTPLHDNLALEFAARELTDERLAARLEEWTR